MAAAIALRGDYDSTRLRELAKRSGDADQVRRLLALALVYDGGSRSEGARAGGVGLQTFRDWVLRFNAAGPDGLVNGKAPGQTPRLVRCSGVSWLSLSMRCVDHSAPMVASRASPSAVRSCSLSWPRRQTIPQ